MAQSVVPTVSTDEEQQYKQNLAIQALNRAVSQSREVLQAARNYYVNNSTGTDAPTSGLSVATPFKTLQYALNHTYGDIDFNNKQVIVNVAAGTYNEKLVLGTFVGFTAAVGYGMLTVQATDATPSNTKITATDGNGIGIFASNNTAHTFKGFQFTNCTVAGVEADSGGVVALDGCEFGSMTGSHMVAFYNSRIVLVNSNYTISGGANTHGYAQFGGEIFIQPGKTVTLSGTPAFGAAFAFAGELGMQNWASTTFSGSATGTRYLTQDGGGIYTNGGGANYLPGNAGGTATAPGWYS